MKDVVCMFLDLNGFMEFYDPAWSAKHLSDFPASGNRASTAGRALLFCSSLSYVYHFLMV